MDSNLNTLAFPFEKRFVDSGGKPRNDRVIEFYEEASMDYGHWSSGFNMHMGFYRLGMNPFNRENLLEQMNLEIAGRLQLEFNEKAFLVDLGCGVGAISRSIAKNYPKSIIKGVTISPKQVNLATRLNELENLQKQIEILNADYTSLPYDVGTADGVWAAESACYAVGSDKEDLIREMARVLKPGGRFVITDLFVIQPKKKFKIFNKKVYSATCKNWALKELPTLEHIVAALKRQGFRNVVVEDISWSVAPCLAHVPFAVFGFILKKLLARKPLRQHSINNLKASLFSLMLALDRAKIRYCVISGRNGGDNEATGPAAETDKSNSVGCSKKKRLEDYEK